MPGEQVCYNTPGTYTCVNSDGSLSSPGGRAGGSSSSTWGQGGRRQQSEGQNFIANNRFPVGGGVSPTPVGTSDVGADGRCPVGYKFNLESMVCDGKSLLKNVSFIKQVINLDKINLLKYFFLPFQFYITIIFQLSLYKIKEEELVEIYNLLSSDFPY